MNCQDGVFNKLVYRSHVMGMEVPDVSSRACRRAPETVMHLLPACPTYAVSAYTQRHNAALRVLYYYLRHSYEIDETPLLPYAPGDIESVVGNEKCLIYWNYSFPTVRQIQANKPDISPPRPPTQHNVRLRVLGSCGEQHCLEGGGKTDKISRFALRTSQTLSRPYCEDNGTDYRSPR